MAYVMVFAVALATGALVFWLTLRASQDVVTASDGDGFLSERPPGGPDAGDGVYVPIGSDRRSWQTRAAGVLGLVIAITLAAALLAFALYQAGSIIADLLSKAAS
jgi:hypothetical protein